MRDLKSPLSPTFGDDPKKDRTLNVSQPKAEPQRTFNFEKSEPAKASGLKSNPFLTDAEAKSKRAALAKDLRTGKIDAKTYKSQINMARTAADVERVKKNAGGSGVKNNRGGSCTPAETRSRSCSKPGKGF